MNQKRKAELQRKLSMTSVPTPPAGLLERIKADIPHDLKSIDRERERFSRSTGFTLRVAASIILLVSSVYVTVRLMSRGEERTMAPPAMAGAKTAAPPAEVTIELAEAAKKNAPVSAAVPAAPAPQRVEQRARLNEVKKEKDAEEPRDQGAVASGVLADRAGAAVGGVSGTIAETQPAPPAAPAAAAAPAVAMNTAAAEEGRRPAMQATAKMAAARADELTVAPPHAVFGLSVDPSAFDRVRQMIEQGQRPEPGSVDVAGVVNYLAGTARPQHKVDLEVETSRAPIDLPMVLIRFTVETAHGDALTPVATDASLQINLNSDAVISHRLIGAEKLKAQSTLTRNISVTGVVDVDLKPGVQPSARIATLRLRYRSIADGKMHTIDRDVRAVQVIRNWESASLRHRLATLGAIWSESVNGGAETGDVAQRAQRLATEAPEDARARALAAAASAFSRLRSSGPTGSGR